MEESTVHKITHAIISNQIALHHNEELKHTPFYKKDLKHKLNQLLPLLIREEKEFDNFWEQVEDQTDEVYKVYSDFITAICSVPIWDAANITAMIEAYKQSPKQIEGIVNKILNK